MIVPPPPVSISVVIPTLNEAPGIRPVLSALLADDSDDLEVIVADGGSVDGTRHIVRTFGNVIWIDTAAGRAHQMNAGAARATGDILVFLHADTILPPDWISEVRRAVGRPRFAVGAFPFTLDQPGRVYRIIAWGVRWRCRLFHLPYGDQALFVTRKMFQSQDGYREAPLMEDVDLVHRLRTQGRLVMAPSAATTSARRWQHRGILRQTWIHWTTYLLYRLRVSPRRLARRHGGARDAVIVFCKYPTPGTVKTRLAATEGQETATRIYRVLVDHTLACTRACQAPTRHTCVFFSPPEAAEAMPEWLGREIRYRAQCEGDLGHRMADAFRQVLGSGAPKAAIIGTDCPQLAPRHLQDALDALDSADLVLGPTYDGGYYLIGLHTPHPELFGNIAWSTNSVLEQTRQAADKMGLKIKWLETLHDLDTAEDLARARRSTQLDL